MFPNVTTIQVAWSGLEAPPTYYLLTHSHWQGSRGKTRVWFWIYRHWERQPLGETVCAVQGMYKGLQVSAVTALVRGSLGVGHRVGGLLFFLPYLLMWFQQKPWLSIFNLKQVWWLAININEHNNNNKTGSSIKWMWSPAVEIFTRCVLPVREILALNLDITSSSWADSRFQC